MKLKHTPLSIDLNTLFVELSNIESTLVSTDNTIKSYVVYNEISALSADIGKIDSALEKILGE